jgi:hypothetical protein
VQEGWRLDERAQIVAYLRAGKVFATWCGHSSCRLDCGNRLLGSTDLTDGEWLWPEGLAHYVQEHSVCLPDEFVATMLSRCWLVPEALQLQTTGPFLEHFGPFGDLSLWLTWARGFPKNLELRCQLEKKQRERAKRRQDDIGLFLRQVLKPGRVTSKDVEANIKYWIAETNKELAALNYKYMDDYYEAVEQAHLAEQVGPVMELVDTRLRLFRLLIAVEHNDNLEQLLTDVLTNREKALALAEQLGIVP